MQPTKEIEHPGLRASVKTQRDIVRVPPPLSSGIDTQYRLQYPVGMKAYVLDTDVLVAAFRSDTGASRQVLEAARARRFDLLLSVPLMLEYESVLTRPESASSCESAASQYRVGLIRFASGRVLVFQRGVFGCSSRMNGKPSSPVLRGLGASNGARPLDNYPETAFEEMRAQATSAETWLPTSDGALG